MNNSVDNLNSKFEQLNINQKKNNIDFVDITNYSDARKIFNCSLEKFLALIHIQNGDYENIQIDNELITHDNINKSILEILTPSMTRMFFDIENIPKEEILFEILDKMIELYDLPKNYALTKNINSTHDGLSYHVYFPLRACKSDVLLLIKDFNFKTDYKYFDYIDYRVYGKNRLFRVVGSKCPGKVGHERNLNDFHNLIQGNLEDTIIQNCNNLPDFNYIFENIEFVESKYSEKIRESIINNKKDKFSDPAKKTWDMFRYPYANFIQNQQEIEKLKQSNKAEKIKNDYNIKETELKIQKDKQDKDFELKKIKEERKTEKVKWEIELQKNKDELELKKQEIEILKLKIQLEKEKRLNNNINDDNK